MSTNYRLISTIAFGIFCAGVFSSIDFHRYMTILAVFAMSIVIFRDMSINDLRTWISPSSWALVLLFMVFGITYTILGFVLGNMGAFSIGKYFVVFPLIYMFVSFIFYCYVDGMLLARIIDTTTTFLLVMVLLSWVKYHYNIGLDTLSFFYSSNHYNLSLEGVFGSYSTPFVSYFLFGATYYFVLYFERIAKGCPRSHFGVMVFWIFTIVALILSGRRIWIYSTVISLGGYLFYRVLLFCFRRYREVRSLYVISFASLGLVLIFTTILSVGINYFRVSGIMSTDYARFFQFLELGWGFGQSSLYGNGFGYVGWGYIRNFNQPWAYELVYLSFLTQVGVVGFAIFTTLVLYGVCKVSNFFYRSEFSPYVIASFLGFVSLIMANATNPYLLKFNGLIYVFIMVWFALAARREFLR